MNKGQPNVSTDTLQHGSRDAWQASGAGASPPHLSAALHVTGRSRFVADEPRPVGLHFVKVLTSPFARARIKHLDLSAARALPGVAAVLSATDIPGLNQIGVVERDEPLLAEQQVAYVGQPLALVVATAPRQAEAARAAIRVSYEQLVPLLEIDAAIQAGAFIGPERRIERGDLNAGFAQAAVVIEDAVHTGAQEHFYLETQCCRAIPQEDQAIVLQTATQSPAEAQEVAARVLGLDSKDITVEVTRLGGGFGGKERGATLWACLAALAAHLTRLPVELRLNRGEDMRWTGKRHPFMARYRIGATRQGRITAYEVFFFSNGGAFTDLSIAVLDRCMLHADNAYFIPNLRAVGRVCRTNLPPNTALRGFGAPQAIFAIEHALQRVADMLELDPCAVRARNSYRPGQLTPYGQPVREACTPELLRRVRDLSCYAALRAEVEQFNRASGHIKQGIGVVPVKFGISFTTSFLNQASALVLVYTDGSVSVSHGGIEMGQEVNTKVGQIVASELGVSLERIRVESHNSKRTANSPPTAASTGSDINGYAARDACRQILRRLRALAAERLAQLSGLPPASGAHPIFRNDRVCDPRRPDVTLAFRDLAQAAYLARIDLAAHGFHQTPGIAMDWNAGQGTPFAYFVFGAALVSVSVDTLSGNAALQKVFIVHECGQSINPAIDRGQIEGAFIQGFGWMTSEELRWDEQGRYLAVSPSTYKIPTIRELPEQWRIEMVQRRRRQASVAGSKAIGEPPLIYGEAAWFAIQEAIAAFAGKPRRMVQLTAPATPEAVLRAIARLR